MDVFGTDMIAEILAPKKTLNFGKKSKKGTWYVTRKSIKCFKSAVGRLFEFGSVN